MWSTPTTGLLTIRRFGAARRTSAGTGWPGETMAASASLTAAIISSAVHGRSMLPASVTSNPAAWSFSCNPEMAVNRAGTTTFGALI
jgi:hypothetical protein